MHFSLYSIIRYVCLVVVECLPASAINLKNDSTTGLGKTLIFRLKIDLEKNVSLKISFGQNVNFKTSHCFNEWKNNKYENEPIKEQPFVLCKYKFHCTFLIRKINATCFIILLIVSITSVGKSRLNTGMYSNT